MGPDQDGKQAQELHKKPALEEEKFRKLAPEQNRKPAQKLQEWQQLRKPGTGASWRTESA